MEKIFKNEVNTFDKKFLRLIQIFYTISYNNYVLKIIDLYPLKIKISFFINIFYYIFINLYNFF